MKEAIYISDRSAEHCGIIPLTSPQLSYLFDADCSEWGHTDLETRVEFVFDLISRGGDISSFLQRFKENLAKYRDINGKIFIPNFIRGLAIIADYLDDDPNNRRFQDMMVERRARPYAGWNSAERLLLDHIIHAYQKYAT